MDDFAVFILTHGRPDNVMTYKTLQRQYIPAAVYIVIDNEDKAADQYLERYGKQVVVFNKAEIAATFDECDNFNIARKAVVYARNACFGIAESLGIKYFLQLDDDYSNFQYRFNSKLQPSYSMPRNLDRLFKIIVGYYKSIPALTIALAQGGDLLGGDNGGELKRLYLKRKAMNSFFCSTDRPFKFIGRINEDVTTYVVLGHRGKLIFTMYNSNIVQAETQTQGGGMTELYQDYGTYIKSFYTVMNAPSCVKIYELGNSIKRLHHRINWNNAVPVIINERHRIASNISNG